MKPSTPTRRPADEWTSLTADEATGPLYVPKFVRGDSVRLVVLFHGAGQTPRSVENVLGHQAREQGFALLLPKSIGPTWDAQAEVTRQLADREREAGQ